MEFIGGTKVTALSPLARMELDGERLADALFRAYLKQMLRDGMFHADPHPGNVFLVNGKIALIDLGMVAHVTPGLQDRLLQLLLAVAENRAEDAAKTLLLIGEFKEDADQTAFRRGVADIIAQHQEVTLQRPQVGRAVLMLLRVAADNGVRLPPELAMIGRRCSTSTRSASRSRRSSIPTRRSGATRRRSRSSRWRATSRSARCSVPRSI